MADDINQAIAGLADYLKQLTAWASLNDKARAKKGQPKIQQKVVLAFEAFLKRHDGQTQRISDAVLSALISALPQVEHRLYVPPKILALLGCTVCRLKQSKIKNELHGELESWIECLTREPTVAKNSDWTGEWVHLLLRTFVDEDSTWDVRINAISMLSKLQENEADIKQIVMQTGVGQKCLLNVGDALMTVPEFAHITTLANFIRLLIPKKKSEERLKYFFRDAFFSRSLCKQFSEFLHSDSVALALALNEERRKHNKALATLDLQDVSINDDDKREISEGQAVMSETCLVIVLRMDESWSTCCIDFKEIANKTLLGSTLVLKSKSTFDSTDTQTIHLRFPSIDQAKEADRQLPGTARPPAIARASIASITVPPVGQQSAQSLTAKERGEKLSEMVQCSPSPMTLPAAKVNPGIVATKLAMANTQETEVIGLPSLTQRVQSKRTHKASRVVEATDSTDPGNSVISPPLAKEVPGTVDTVEVTQSRVVETVESVLTAPPPPPPDETISDAPVFQIAPPRSMQKQPQSQGPPATEASRATPTSPLISPPPIFVSGSSAGKSPSMTRASQPAQPVQQPASRIVPHNSKEVDSLFDAMANSHARSLTRRPVQSSQEPAKPASGSTTDDLEDDDGPSREIEAPPDSQQKQPEPVKLEPAKKPVPMLTSQSKAGRQTYKTPGKKQRDEPEASELSSPSPPPAKQPSSAKAAAKKVNAQLKKPGKSLKVKVPEAEDDAETDYDMPTSPMQKPKTKRGAAAKKKAPATKKAASKKKTPAKKTASKKQDSDVDEDAVPQQAAPAPATPITGLKKTRAQTSRAKQATGGEKSSRPAQDSSERARAAPSSTKKRKNRDDVSEDGLVRPSKKHASPVSMPRIEHLVNDNAVKRPEIVHWTKQGPERGQTEHPVVPVEQVKQHPSRQASVDEHAYAPGMEVGYVSDQDMSPMAPPEDDAQDQAQQAPLSKKSPSAKADDTQQILSPLPTKQTDRLSIQRMISSDPLQDADELPSAEVRPLKDKTLTQPEREPIQAVADLAAKVNAPRMAAAGGPSSTRRSQVPSSPRTAVEGSTQKLVAGHQAVAQTIASTPKALPIPGRAQQYVTPLTVVHRARTLDQSAGALRAAATSTIGQIQHALNTTSIPIRRTVPLNQPESTPIRLGGLLRTGKATTPSATSRAVKLPTTATTRTDVPATADKLHMLLQQRGLLPEPVVSTTADAPGLDLTVESSESSDETDHHGSQKRKRGKTRQPSFKQSLAPLHREAYEILENATREMIQSLQQSEARVLGVADGFSTQCDGVLDAFRESSDASAAELLEKLNASMRVCFSS